MLFLYLKFQGKDVSRVRRKVYRCCLFTALILSVFTLCMVWILSVYRKIPEKIRLRAGEEQVIDIGVPVEGEIKRVDRIAEEEPQEEKAVTTSGIHIDLRKPVTMKADDYRSYQMELKLFGVIPFKQVGIDVIKDKTVTPVGLPIGIYLKTEGVLVIGIGDFKDENNTAVSPAAFVLKTGDYILEVNGEKVENKKDFIAMVEDSGGENMHFKIKRGEESFEVQITPKKNQSGVYKIGVWVRDNAQGIGTMTFVDSEGNFGALGHGISDADAGINLELYKGTLYRTQIIAVRKGEKGNPGEMTGMIEYSDRNILGEITVNSDRGIYGVCNEKMMEQITEEPVNIALRQEVKEGPDKILCTIGNKTDYYDIRITKIRTDSENLNKEIVLEVTDPELLSATGGIIQGMSGAPILQDGKLVGAVTHVLVNDPTKGYGIFIENMLKY